VDHENYVWKRGHFELSSYENSNRAEKVLMYMDGFWGPSLTLLFKEDDNSKRMENNPMEGQWQISSWLDDTGILYKEGNDSDGVDYMVNLNKPSVIAELIRYYRKSIWNPKETKQPIIIEEALLLLDQIDTLKTRVKKP
jgi:hypothetical protein